MRSRARPGSRSRRRTGLHAISGAIVKIVGAISTTPDDQFIAGPHSRMVRPTYRGVYRAGRCPTVRGGSISRPSVQYASRVIVAGPNDHFAAAPHCRVIVSTSGRVCDTGGTPAVSGWVVPAAAV